MPTDISRTSGQTFTSTFVKDDGTLNVTDSNETIRQRTQNRGGDQVWRLYQHKNRIYNPAVRFFRNLANAVFDPKHLLDHEMRKKNGGDVVIQSLRKEYGDTIANAVLKKVGIDVDKSSDKWTAVQFNRSYNRNLRREITGSDVHRINDVLDAYIDKHGDDELQFFKANKEIKDLIANAKSDDNLALQQIKTKIDKLYDTFAGDGMHAKKSKVITFDLLGVVQHEYAKQKDRTNFSLDELKSFHAGVFSQVDEGVTRRLQTAFHNLSGYRVQQVKTHVDPTVRPVTAADMAALVKRAYNYEVYKARDRQYFEKRFPAEIYNDQTLRAELIQQTHDEDRQKMFDELNSLTMYDAKMKIQAGINKDVDTHIDLDENTIEVQIPPWERAKNAEGDLWASKKEWFDAQLNLHNISKSELQAAAPGILMLYPQASEPTEAWALKQQETDQEFVQLPENVAQDGDNDPTIFRATQQDWMNFEKALDAVLAERGITNVDDVEVTQEEIDDLLGVAKPGLSDKKSAPVAQDSSQRAEALADDGDGEIVQVGQKSVNRSEAIDNEDTESENNDPLNPQNAAAAIRQEMEQSQASTAPLPRVQALSTALDKVLAGWAAGQNNETIKLNPTQFSELQAFKHEIDQALQQIEQDPRGGDRVHVKAAWQSLHGLMYPASGSGLSTALAPISLELAQAYTAFDRIMSQ